jgi:hypothetical protein
MHGIVCWIRDDRYLHLDTVVTAPPWSCVSCNVRWKLSWNWTKGKRPFTSKRRVWERGYVGGFTSAVPVVCSMWTSGHLARTHRFHIVTKQDVPQVAGALVSLHVQLSLWTYRSVSFAFACSRKLSDTVLTQSFPCKFTLEECRLLGCYAVWLL